MNGLRRRLDAWWYARRRPPWWLRQLSRLYVHWRPRSAPPRQHAFPACIIVIGNIVAGGAGKTPLVIALCHLLQRHGYRVGVVSRGYGRRQRELRWVDAASDEAEVGDEPLLIQRETGVPVVVAAQRRAAVEALLRRQPLDVVLADDGLQHQTLPRDLEICLVDGRRGLGNGWLLPAGPLREPPEILARMDRVVYKECQPSGLPLGDIMPVHVNEAVNLHSGERRSLSHWRGTTVQALAGIGNPESFFAALRAAGLTLQTHSLGDHQRCSEHRARQLCAAGALLMTAKDAVKWPQSARDNAWQVPLQVSLPGTFTGWLLAEVARVNQARRAQQVLAAQAVPPAATPHGAASRHHESL